MSVDVKKLGALYRKSQRSEDPRLQGLAEEAMKNAMEANAVLARLDTAQALLAEACAHVP